MSTPPPPLPWSTRLTVSPPTTFTSTSLSGDKLHLPQSSLEQLLSAASLTPSSNHPPPSDPWAAAAAASRSSSQRTGVLPHPMIVKLTNPQTCVSTYGVPREFSADESTITLSPFLYKSLGLDHIPSTDDDLIETTPTGAPLSPTLHLDIEAASLPKGTKVRLRPLEPGYDEEDWKSILEQYLRDNFATVSEGMVLEVPQGHGRRGVWRFLVDQAEPRGWGGVCVIDTDLEVDIEPLDEAQARETVRRRTEKRATGGRVKVGEVVKGVVGAGEEEHWELGEWEKGRSIEVMVEMEGEEVEEGRDLDVMVVTDREHMKPRLGGFVWGDLGWTFPKRVRIEAEDEKIVGAEKLLIGIRGWRDPNEGPSKEEDGSPRGYSLRITQSPETTPTNTLVEDSSDPDSTPCPNCHQPIPTRTLPLHTTFCARNNIPCPHPSCNRVFLRNSPSLSSHWHCPSASEDFCLASGDSPLSLLKHNTLSHTPLSCPSCSSPQPSLLHLSHHTTTTCPQKLLLCPFCHLLVPQLSPPPSTLLPSAHELECGSRTTSCPQPRCTRRVRLRDLEVHLQTHELDRLDPVRNPIPLICCNPNCYRSRSDGNGLGLCEVCYGPLYAPGYDPDGSALRARIERRLVKQMVVGCGRAGCGNREACKIGAGEGWGMGEARKRAGDMVKRGELGFCVDQETGKRRGMAMELMVEGGWGWEWCCRAVEVGGGRVEEGRRWVEGFGVREGER